MSLFSDAITHVPTQGVGFGNILSGAQYIADVFKPKTGNPLQGLTARGYNVNSFTYPIDLFNDPGEQHALVFFINETSNTQFKTTNQSGWLNPTGISPTPFSQSAIARVPGSILDQPTINLGYGNVTNWSKRPIRRISTAIALYIPPQVRTSYAANWDSTEFNAAGGVVKALGNSDYAGALKEMGLGVLRGALDDAKNFVQGRFGVETDIAGGISLYTRMAFNPHAEMLFRGIGFRTWQFEYVFTPRSEQEAWNVANVIKAFKFYSAPEVKTGDGQPRYWIYPAEFDLMWLCNGKESNFLNKISTCALTNVDIDYTGSGGWSAYRPGKFNGVPVETHLTLTFQELEIMTKERILQGY